MKLFLLDDDPKMVEAWDYHFNGYDNVQVYDDFDDIDYNIHDSAMVLPINSFGFIPRDIEEKLDSEKLNKLKKDIAENISYFTRINELLVGETLTFEYDNGMVSHITVAPTSRSSNVRLEDTVNIYLAMKGILRNTRCEYIICQKLDSYCDYDVQAYQMKMAWDDIVLKRWESPPKHISEIVKKEQLMMRCNHG